MKQTANLKLQPFLASAFLLHCTPLLLCVVLLLGGCTSRDANKASKMEQADLRYAAGWQYMRNGQLLMARSEFEAAVNIYPELAEYYHALGLAHFYLENFSIAEKRIQEAIRISSGIPMFYQNLANVYIAQERWQEAIDNAELALQYPNFDAPAAAHFLIGTAYFNLGNGVEARKALNEAVRVNPDFVNPYIKLAQLDLQEGDCVAALEHIRPAHTITRENPEPNVLVTYARVMFCFDRYYEGVDSLITAKRLLQRNPGNGVLLAEAETLLAQYSDELRDRQRNTGSGQLR